MKNFSTLFQQQLYGTLVEITDPNSGHVGGSNIEFEEKAYTAISGWIEYFRESERFFEQNPTGLFVEPLPEGFPDTNALIAWSGDLVNKHFNKKGNIEYTSEELDKWFEALSTFQRINFDTNGCGRTDVYGCPIDKSILPKALLNIFNDAINNCN